MPVLVNEKSAAATTVHKKFITICSIYNRPNQCYLHGKQNSRCNIPESLCENYIDTNKYVIIFHSINKQPNTCT